MNAAIGLRVGRSLIDSSFGFSEGGDYQKETAIQVWKFVDCQRTFGESQANLVLKAVQVRNSFLSKRKTYFVWSVFHSIHSLVVVERDECVQETSADIPVGDRTSPNSEYER
jgi:hypothetical protein